MKYNPSGHPCHDGSAQHPNLPGSRHDAPSNVDGPLRSHSNGRKAPPRQRDVVEGLSKGCTHLNLAPDVFSLS